MPPPPVQSAAEPLPPGRLPSLSEAHRSIALPDARQGLRRLLAFLGPGYLVAVGYIDPGNWATDLAGGSAFGFRLLWIVLLANCMAVLLQILAARLGIVTGMDLAQACRQRYSRRSALAQWLLAELAICATDLAEVIGMAIALQLLFGLPLAAGVVLTAADTLLFLWLQQRGFRRLEAFVIALLATIFACFAGVLAIAGPDWGAVARGFVPNADTVTRLPMLLIAVGILGATVMPHNLYLHSAAVQTRRYEQSEAGRREAVRYASIDTAVALSFALLINAAILVTAGAVFHANGLTEIAGLQDAHAMLTPLLGTAAAALLFGVALLASGQSSTLAATLAGQVVMEGFVQMRMAAWKRRLLTRSIAVLPALAVTLAWGEDSLGRLLIASQIVLSLQLPFAIVPLVRLTSDARLMGPFANGRAVTVLAWIVAVLVVTLNLLMVAQVALAVLGGEGVAGH